jgi:hypothetical protein
VDTAELRAIAASVQQRRSNIEPIQNGASVIG